VDARDAEERTPLHWACTRGHTSMVLLLLEKGAIPDVEDCRGVRPIYEAAKKKSCDHCQDTARSWRRSTLSEDTRKCSAYINLR
jgi:hypothetical protein